jgi:hypothetical protein
MLKESEKLSKTFYIWFLVVLFIISLVANIYLMQNESKVKLDSQFIKQKNEQIAKTLERAKNELKKHKGVSAKMDEIVKDATQKLEEKERKIRVLLSDKKLLDSENQRLIQEIDSIKEKYFDSIDSLLVAKQLNKSLNNTLDLMYERMDELTTKLGYASRLNVEALTVKPLKKSFANKEMQTALAKRTLKIKICFDVMDNKVTDPGMKDFYIRILTPDAVGLTDSEEPLTFMHPELKQKVIYTKEETINYKNQKTNICFKWEGTEQYIPGLYIVEVFTKDNKLGMTTFTLK